MSERPLIQIQNLDFAYGDRLVLKHVSLDVQAGSTLGLIGPNGGGKTTLLKLLLGLHRPTRGTILIDGMTPADAIRRGDVIGYLPQKPLCPPTFPMSVRQAIRLGLAGKTGPFRAPPKDCLDFVDSLIDRVGLRDQADAPLGELSGGQQQRAFIARAVAARPKLLLLDEPTTGIDRAGQHQFVSFIQSLKDELGLTVVFSSHDLSAVSAMSDRIACLNVTLHYHDVPAHVPADVVYQMFACDVDILRGGAK